MTILVTGATGFIGRAVMRTLRDRGLDHVAFEGDVRNRADFLAAPACDALIHLAGLTRTDGSYEAQRRLMDINVTGTLHALDHARRHGAHFVFAGSCNYGRARVIPTPETEPITAGNPYALSKSVCEQAIAAWNRHFGLASATVLRIFNPYGPGQQQGFLVADMVEKIRSGAVSVYSRAAVRDFIFVDDLAELAVGAALRPGPGVAVVNAGTGQGHSVGEVVETMLDLLGLDLPVHDQGRPEVIPASIADVRTAEALFGWRAQTGLRPGLARVLEDAGLLQGRPAAGAAPGRQP
ncbi:NAD-dependent epimerase/dehydratase family protein [Desulfocurvus vexinensis]|uniref:NAD-dependent epimerase/dehydratase family protein n=1 Tax=Desulfocurvus vexinensis TaxID=399548 RepID=UPI00048E0D3C|nr:NAD(P)-dependent oxidoreductase [Desulfocurvus vexinensis]